MKLEPGPGHGHSLRTMASVLGRAPSTVNREHTRIAVQGPHRACTAHTLASARLRQARRPRKPLDPWLWHYVRTQLAEGCSLEQMAGRLNRAYPDDRGNSFRLRLSMRDCLRCPAAPCGANCWPHGLGREEQTDAARSPT